MFGNQRRWCILHLEEPSAQMKELLQQTQPTPTGVSYVRGSPASFKDLKKAHANNASSIFIMARKLNYGEAREDDAEVVTMALTVNMFGIYSYPQSQQLNQPYQLHNHAKYLIYTQILLPESVEHMEYLQTTRTMCVDRNTEWEF